jgi:hypothetical protein
MPDPDPPDGDDEPSPANGPEGADRVEGNRNDVSAPADGSGAADRMEAALRELRREGLKAAAVYAVVDAVAVFLVVNLLVSVLEPGWFPGQVPMPSAVAGRVGLTGATLPASALVGAGAGVLAFGGELADRARRSTVEQFEAANPRVAEALRTARDAVESGADSRMASRLYDDVLAGLRESSSLGLVDARRVGATLALVVVLSVLTVQAAVVDVTLAGTSPAADDADGAAAENYTGLKDGDQVLGEPEAVTVGTESREARVESTGGGREVEGESFPDQAGGGVGDGGGSDIEGQQAGFTDPETVEEADLVREYNQRIREDAGEDSR